MIFEAEDGKILSCSSSESNEVVHTLPPHITDVVQIARDGTSDETRLPKVLGTRITATIPSIQFPDRLIALFHKPNEALEQPLHFCRVLNGTGPLVVTRQSTWPRCQYQRRQRLIR